MKLRRLSTALRTAPAPQMRMASASWRSGKTSAQRGYDYRWQKAREAFLWRNPMCAYCMRDGRAETATVVDHVVPHRGDKKLFWDRKNWQPLCKPHHDAKTPIEGS